MTRILVADDHPLFREALSGALEPYFENAQIIQAGSLDDAMAKLNEFDGVELIGSHGYLISQFLNPRLNRREDAVINVDAADGDEHAVMKVHEDSDEDPHLAKAEGDHHRAKLHVPEPWRLC